MGDTSVLTVTNDNEIVMGAVNVSAMLLPGFGCTLGIRCDAGCGWLCSWHPGVMGAQQSLHMFL